MGARTEAFELETMRLSSGEAASAELTVPLDALTYGEQTYREPSGEVRARLDVSRTTGNGYSLRLRFDAALEGPCMRCLGDAGAHIEVDAREIEQPGAGDDDLHSPYVDGVELDLRGWARDALALALPSQIFCSEDCKGLCAICGENLNERPHEHEREPDPRWAKLGELKLE